MNKKLKTISAMLLAIVMVFSLTACGKKAPPPAEEPPEETPVVEAIPDDTQEEEKGSDVESIGTADNVTTETLVGHYYVVHMSGSNNDVSDEDLEMMKNLGLTVSLDIYEDNTAVLTVFDEEVNLTYDIENRMFMMDDMECGFKFAQEELTIYEGESTMVFRKLSNKPGPIPYNQAEFITDMLGKYVLNKEYVKGPVIEVVQRGSSKYTVDGVENTIDFDLNKLTAKVTTLDEDGDPTETYYDFIFYNGDIIMKLQNDQDAEELIFEPYDEKEAKSAIKAAEEAEKAAEAEAAAKAEAEEAEKDADAETDAEAEVDADAEVAESEVDGAESESVEKEAEKEEPKA